MGLPILDVVGVLLIFTLVGIVIYLYMLRRREIQREEVKTILFNYLPLEDYEMNHSSVRTISSANSRTSASRTTIQLPDSLAL